MLKRDVVELVKEKMNCNAKDASRAIDAVLDAIVEGCILHGEVSLRSFGRFRISKRNARIVKTPITKKAVSVPARKTLHFKPSRSIVLL